MPDDPKTQLRRVVPDDPEAQLRRVAADMQSRFTVSTLTVWLQQRLGQQLGALTSSGDFGQICLDVVKKAEEQKWLDRLLMSLVLAAPNRESALQALLSAVDSFAKVDLIAKLQEAFPRVCRIKLWTPAGDVHGTGFLVGPDLVLTNYHVAQPLIEHSEDVGPDDMVIQFDAVEPNAESADIVHCRLHSRDWHVASSPYHALDDQPDKPGDSYEVPDHREFADHLDYALLRLEETVGSTVSRLFARERGWYSLPEKKERFASQATIIIVQHPKGDPLCMAWRPGGVVGVNRSHTRVAYAVNTNKGSSGAPCFDNNGALVALHNLGIEGCYNRGIPISIIRSHMDGRGNLPATPYVPATRPAASPPAARLDKLSMVDGLPFVGRSKLRGILYDILTGNGRNTLIVTGLAGSGRSFTARALVHVLRPDKFDVVRLYCAPPYGRGPDSIIQQAARQIALPLEGLPPEPQNRQDARWLSELADWFAGQVRLRNDSEGKPLWLVIDGCDKVQDSDDLNALANSLMQAAIGHPTLRVALLGYTGDVNPDIVDDIEFDEVRVAERTDVETFFQNLLALNKRQVADDTLTAIVDKVLTAAGNAATAKLTADVAASAPVGAAMATMHNRYFMGELRNAITEAIRLLGIGESR